MSQYDGWVNYNVPKLRAQELPDFYTQQILKTRAVLKSYKKTRLEVIFGYELYYIEHFFLCAEHKGSRYWAEKGLQKAERVIEAAKFYPKALEKPVRAAEGVRLWTRFSQLVRWTFSRFSPVRVGRTRW